MKYYFAHPVTDYNTPREQEVLDYLEDFYEVINPNEFFVKKEYDAQGMEYFKSFVEKADFIVFTRFPNGKIGSGVAKELEWAHLNNQNIYEYDFQSKIIEYRDFQIISKDFLTVQETKRFISLQYLQKSNNKVISFQYCNYEGKISYRFVIPERILWGRNEFHKEDTWLMWAYDLDRRDNRWFNMKDILDLDLRTVFNG